MANKLIAKTEPKIDVHKLVDDAMEKKDRIVYILINGENTSISVTPLSENDPRWIDITPKPEDDENYGVFIRQTYKCSECGQGSSLITPYCPMCGEKLKI